jgi:hypothetical protein
VYGHLKRSAWLGSRPVPLRWWPDRICQLDDDRPRRGSSSTAHTHIQDNQIGWPARHIVGGRVVRRSLDVPTSSKVESVPSESLLSDRM